MNKCAIILAGGEGKRMKADIPKTMTEVLSKPMLSWVIDSVKKAGIEKICVVTGYKKECIEDYLAKLPYNIETAYQAQRLGTGHAVMMAENFLMENDGDVVILNGDAPFMDYKTISDAYNSHINGGYSATVISAVIDDPTGYGRIVRDGNDELLSIIEQKDADDDVLKIKEVNSGAYWFNTKALLSVLNKITAENNAKEYYLPDALKYLLADGKKIGAYASLCSDTVLGANDPMQLKMLNDIALLKGYPIT